MEAKKRESMLLGASVPHPTPPPGTESNFWPTMPSREQSGYPKSDPGGDPYYAGCLGQNVGFAS